MNLKACYEYAHCASSNKMTVSGIFCELGGGMKSPIIWKVGKFLRMSKTGGLL
jgi:hypothetical protein